MEKGNGGFSEAFFPALSDWVFRGDVSGLTTEMLQRMNLAPYAYLFRRDETMRPRLLALQAQSIKLRYAMQCVGKLLASGGIDFCPLKGADL
ncbi:MAG: hypothetical protein MJ016_05020, partial [Victivallaceae bacterium]|nr:hypothetical protein [Victivallaceae bacterium]